MKTSKLALLALSAVVAVSACGSDDTTPTDGGKKDGPRDGIVDTKPPADTSPAPDGPKLDVAADTAPPDGPRDTGADVTADTAPPTDTAPKLDTTPDLPPPKLDAAPDTTPDAGIDAPPVPDAAPDAAADTAPVVIPDGGPDAGADTAADTAPPDAAPVACTPVGPDCAPQLGLQIDRMGRAGVNTALTDPFWDDGVQTLADHHIKQDKYNQASNPATWGDVELATGKKTKDLIKGALAAYDSLDGTSDGAMTGDGCGNQLAYAGSFGGTAFPDYSLLATVLTDDRLYVNTASGSCNTYLGVEAAALGITNTDCGGRTPTYNAIDVTYTALTTGKLSTPSCSTNCDVSNGIPADFDKGAGYAETTFPFLGAPIP